jgi:hypothetical protein
MMSMSGDLCDSEDAVFLCYRSNNNVRVDPRQDDEDGKGGLGKLVRQY